MIASHKTINGYQIANHKQNGKNDACMRGNDRRKRKRSVKTETAVSAEMADLLPLFILIISWATSVGLRRMRCCFEAKRIHYNFCEDLKN